MDILIYGHPLLRKSVQPVLEINHDIYLAAQQLLATMFAADGLGLAAPQVGIRWRMFALAVPAPKFSEGEPSPAPTPGEVLLLPRMPLVLINPQIISYGAELLVREEGCLSIPEVYAEVTRPAAIFLSAQTIDNENLAFECGGLLGRAVQHELDHLDGKLFVDRLEPGERQKINSKLERLKKHKIQRRPRHE